MTVAVKFGDDLALTRKMPLAFANMAFNLREVGDNQVPIHTHNNSPAEVGVPRRNSGGKRRWVKTTALAHAIRQRPQQEPLQV